MDRLILRGAQIFDATGRPAQSGRTVVIEHDRIADMVADGQADGASGARVIDLAGCTLLPGLIDLHVHLGWGQRVARDSDAAMALRAARNARAALDAGITTIRDVGTANGVAIAVRDGGCPWRTDTR